MFHVPIVVKPPHGDLTAQLVAAGQDLEYGLPVINSSGVKSNSYPPRPVEIQCVSS